MASTSQSTHDAEITTRLPQQIQDAISKEVQSIDFKETFIEEDGDYVDGVTVSDVTHPLSFGIDNSNRAFLCIKYKCNGKEIVETLFQRYTGDNRNWTVGSYGDYRGALKKTGYLLNYSIFSGSYEDKSRLTILKQICDNGFIYNIPL